MNCRARHHHIAGLICHAPARRHFGDTVDSILQAIGVGPETAAAAAPVISGAAIGAGGGAAIGAATGGNIGRSALIGAGVGGAAGAIPEITSALDIGGGAGTTTTDIGGAPSITTGPLDTPTGAVTGSPAAPAGISAVSAGPPVGSNFTPDFTAVAPDPESAAGGPGAPNIGGAGGSVTQLTENPTPPIGSTAPSGGGAPVSSGQQIAQDLKSGSFGEIPGDIGSAVLKNPGALVAGAGLLFNATRDQRIPGTRQLSNEASDLASQGKLLSSYLQSGTLPPGVQTSIDLATKSAIAGVRSKYAALGIPGGTAELQEINNIRMTAATQGVQIAEQLLQTGINETGLATSIYENLVRINETQAQQTGAAISNFAQALNGFSSVGNSITLRAA